MRYFYDTEFIEDGKTIDLISIGIVAEDGREYYAISKEFNECKASDWVQENVITQLPPKYIIDNESSGSIIQNKLYKSRFVIKNEILRFIGDDKPEFWAYYADYDHVVLCQLFGTMMDLPDGWPMYTRDLKQLCDEVGNPKLPKQQTGEHNALDDALWVKDMYIRLARLAVRP